MSRNETADWISARPDTPAGRECTERLRRVLEGIDDLEVLIASLNPVISCFVAEHPQYKLTASQVLSDLYIPLTRLVEKHLNEVDEGSHCRPFSRVVFNYLRGLYGGTSRRDRRRVNALASVADTYWPCQGTGPGGADEPAQIRSYLEALWEHPDVEEFDREIVRLRLRGHTLASMTSIVCDPPSGPQPSGRELAQRLSATETKVSRSLSKLRDILGRLTGMNDDRKMVAKRRAHSEAHDIYWNDGAAAPSALARECYALYRALRYHEAIERVRAEPGWENDAEAHRLIGSALHYLRRYAEARAAYATSESLCDRPRFVSNSRALVAVAWYEEGDLERASAEYEAAVAFDPRSAFGYLGHMMIACRERSEERLTAAAARLRAGCPDWVSNPAVVEALLKDNSFRYLRAEPARFKRALGVNIGSICPPPFEV